MKIIILAILAVINIPMYRWSFKTIFGNMEGFYECLKYDFTPDIVSLFRGRLLQDMAAEWKLSSFILMNMLLFVIEYMFISKLLGIFGLVI